MVLQGMDLFMDLLSKSNYIVALTGAGISKSAGIPVFRGKDGIYNRPDFPSDKIFDLESFVNHPELFYNHFDEIFKSIEQAKPTKGHLFLKKLEDLGKLKCVITQNIDSLHQKAGNSFVIDLHGNVESMVCLSCKKHFAMTDSFQQAIINKNVPRCTECGGVLKPNVVFFKEPVRAHEKALTEVQNADLLIVMGSSLTVYPASFLPSYLSENAKLIILNEDETSFDHKASVVLRESIDEIVIKTKIIQ